MLRQPLFFWSGCLSIQFFNLPLPLTQSVRPPMATYPSLCSTCVTYGTPCHARGHQVLPHPLDVTFLEVLQDAMPRQKSPIGYLGKRRISPGVISILSMYLHLHNLLITKRFIAFCLSFMIAQICE